MKSIAACSLLVLTLVASFAARPLVAQEVDKAAYEQLVTGAIGYLITTQADDGSYSSYAGPGVTAIVTTGILRHGRTADDPLVARSLDYLETFVRDDGGIYSEGSRHQNYETSVAVMCFSAANADGRYDELLANAANFLKGIQWGADGSIDESDFAYGGAGYGRHNRPDLSNTGFFLEALESVNTAENDDAIQRALIFVSRCQNLETEYNQTPFAASNPDGSFYYTPAAGGSSEAGETPEGGLRGYGSMTYTGLKSMLYAGVDAEDPRVEAAVAWIKAHYTLEENPGMGSAGLYYYYHTFAKALSALGENPLVDSSGNEHNWQADFIATLQQQQNDDGSWVNANERWLEGDANLVTGYALLALSYCRPAGE